MDKHIKVVFRLGLADFYKRHGKGWARRPFYTCGNLGAGEEFAGVLMELGHTITFVEWPDQPEETL